MRSPKLRVLIVEHHPDYREYLQELLDSKLEPNIETLTTAEAGNALVLIPIFRPEIIVMSGEMPHICGAEMTRKIHQYYPAIDVILVVDDDDQKFRHCGALQVFLKTEVGTKLVHLLKSQNWGHAIGRRMRTIFGPAGQKSKIAL
jgi:DNA-binding NarL/FixJ family response regulator